MNNSDIIVEVEPKYEEDDDIKDEVKKKHKSKKNKHA